MKAARRTELQQTAVSASAASHDPLLAVRRAAGGLLEQLQTLQPARRGASQVLWAEHVAAVQELVQFLDRGGTARPGQHRGPAMSAKQWREFGRLLHDRRHAAGFSRLQLAQLAQLSDSTIKFIETAHHPPSRASLIRLLNVPALRLRWADVPGQSPCLGGSAPEPVSADCGALTTGSGTVILLDRVDFDELGDPIYVRQVGYVGQEGFGAPLHDHDLPAGDQRAAGDFIPLRR